MDFLFQKKCFEFFDRAVEIIPANKISIQRAQSLMEKYKDIPMDYADATLVALAEEIKSESVFTLDQRGFQTYRWNRNQTFKILPS